MKKIIASLLLLALTAHGAVKDIRIPQIVSGTTFTYVVVSPTASSIQIFDALKVPGTMALDTDLNAFLTAGTLASLNTALGVTLSTFDGSALNASNLSSGTIPDARFPATLPVLNGSSLTNVIATTNANLTGIVTSVGNATAIADGAIPIAKLAASSISINGSGVSLGGSVSNLQTTNGTLALAGFSGVTGSLPAANLPATAQLTDGVLALAGFSSITGTLAIANGGTGITSFGTGVAGALGNNVSSSGGLVIGGAITSSGLTQATARLLGRTTASTGAVEELTAGAGLSLSAGSLTTTTAVRTGGVTAGVSGVLVVTGKTPGFNVIDYSGTITGWSITVDAGTCTVKVWKIAAGTAKPTVANVINTSGVAISSGTSIRSTNVSDFTTTTVTAQDIFAIEITAVSGATDVTFELEITKP